MNYNYFFLSCILLKPSRLRNNQFTLCSVRHINSQFVWVDSMNLARLVYISSISSAISFFIFYFILIFLVLWLSSKKKIVKGILHPKIAILSSFIHQHVVPNLYEFLSAVEHKRKNFEKCLRAFSIQWKSRASTLCGSHKERKLYRFGMIFRWNTPLNSAFITMFFIVMSIQIRFFFYSFTSCIFQKYRFTVVNYLLLQCKQLLNIPVAQIVQQGQGFNSQRMHELTNTLKHHT